MERELITQGLGHEVQVTTCGCIGMCDDGPIIIIYPEGVWYHKIQEEDVPEIVNSHLGSGAVMLRLAWSDLQAMKAEATEHRDRYRAMPKARDEADTLPDDLNQMIRGFIPAGRFSARSNWMYLPPSAPALAPRRLPKRFMPIREPPRRC